MPTLAVVSNTEVSEDVNLAKRWHARIMAEKKAHDDWRKEAQDAWEAYLPDDKSYPLLWSVTSIQHSAIYSARPIPISKPRSSIRTPAVKAASDVLERGLEYAIDQTEFDDTMHRVVDDYLVAGFGVPRVKLDADIEDQPVIDPMTGQPMRDLEGEVIMKPVVLNQVVRAEFVPWSRLGWEPSECWEHVDWIYFRHRMKAKEIVARYGEDASFGEGGQEFSSDSTDRDGQAYWIYEIWDRENLQVLHLAEGGTEPLKVDSDPLKLKDFYPIPPPVLTNVLYDKLVPKPDYILIQCFDEELDRLYERASSLIEQIKAITFHDASLVELKDFGSIADGTSISIKNILERLNGGGLDALILPWPIQEKIVALQNVNTEIVAKRAQVDELLGISDILRGASNPQDGQETQKIKERWGGIRLRRKQVAIQHQIRNLFRLMAEVTVTHVTRDILEKMTQTQITDEVWAILQDDAMRCFSIDLETDSTVAKDEFADKQARNELLGAINQWAQVMAPQVNANQIPADLAKEALIIAVQPYGQQARGLDQVIDTLTSTQQQLQQMQQLQGQIQQLTQQMQQKDYALAQYSQAEEARQNAESQSKVQYEGAKTAEIHAGLTDEQVQAGKTVAETQHTQAQTAQITHEMMKPEPIKEDCGCP